MSEQEGIVAQVSRGLNRWQARRATRAKAVTAFRSAPEPRTIGSFAKGRQLLAGNYLFSGSLVQAPAAIIWDVPVPSASWSDEIHGFAWLDDLAAVSDMHTRNLAQEWLWGWIHRYGRGAGPGWTPDLTGRRLIRWINHAMFVLRGQGQEQSDEFFRALGQQTVFLGKRWHAAAPGLPRFEALTGLLHASLSLEGMEEYATPAVEALGRECEAQIDAQGGLPTRNPEELLSVFTLLTWATAVLTEAGKPVPDGQMEAIARIAPTLRTLRHSDGGLARFHGGGRGQEGWLDHALAASGVKKRSADGLAMGFARISAGRTSVIVDAAIPPKGKASHNAHASTLAFELTSGRRPVVVNCGSGIRFGSDWRRAGRATPSHSTLCLDGFSSGRLGDADGGSSRELLLDSPEYVPIEMNQAPDGLRFQGGHDGYLATHGLTHARTLELTFDGRGLVGEDLLMALDGAHKKRFDEAMNAKRLAGIPFDIRFHLHPDADAQIDMGGTAVSIVVKSGEIWVFRHDGRHKLTLEPSVYLEQSRLKPRASKQLVLSGRISEHAARVRWSLSKAQETAIGVRDMRQDEEPYASMN